MQVAQVQFAKWDKMYDFSLNNLSLKQGDRVIVETELGMEMGVIAGFKEAGENAATAPIFENSETENEEEKKKEIAGGRVIKPILRKATEEDFSKLPTMRQRDEAFEFARQAIIKRELPMKLVDAVFSYSGNRLTFAFISDGRVDFRELVKDLTAHFNMLVRLTQIGIRDEARFMGDCGHCGRPLCCRGFLKDFSSIGSEMAEAQQVVHRGSERISGVCGRLMCCLQYEYQGYRELAEKMPSIGQRVNVDGKKGTVISCHVLKQTVRVEFDNEKEGKTIVEVDLNRNHKKTAE